MLSFLLKIAAPQHQLLIENRLVWSPRKQMSNQEYSRFKARFTGKCLIAARLNSVADLISRYSSESYY